MENCARVVIIYLLLQIIGGHILKIQIVGSHVGSQFRFANLFFSLALLTG